MTIDELHNILYDIICAVDDVCKKENIPYFLTGGTMLGAIRHKGFIPWDDDADLAVWSKDYNTLITALKKYLPDYYSVVEPTDEFPHFFDFITHIQDTRYYWHEPNEEDKFYNNKQNYICIDIFIYSECSNTKLGTRLYGLAYKILYGLAMGHRYMIHDEGYSFAQKLETTILSTIGKFIPISMVYSVFKWLAFKNKKPKKYYVPCNDLVPYLGRYWESAWTRKSINMQFRDRELPISEKYDSLMTFTYGDYMKPPKDLNAYIRHMDFDDVKNLEL